MFTDIYDGNTHPQAREQLNKLASLAQERGLSGAIANPHITLFSSRDLKPLRKRMELSNKGFKEWIRDMISSFPAAPPITLDMNHLFMVEKDVNASAFLLLENETAIIEWSNEVMAHLGVLPKDIEEPHILHMSIANITGNPQDSVANPYRGGTLFVLKPQRHEEFPAFDFTLVGGEE